MKTKYLTTIPALRGLFAEFVVGQEFATIDCPDTLSQVINTWTESIKPDFLSNGTKKITRENLSILIDKLKEIPEFKEWEFPNGIDKFVKRLSCFIWKRTKNQRFFFGLFQRKQQDQDVVFKGIVQINEGENGGSQSIGCGAKSSGKMTFSKITQISE